MNATERNTALHFETHRPASMPRVVRSRRVPLAPRRFVQQAACKLGLTDWERRWLEPLVQARREAGYEAGPPRFLIRVDEFPYATAYDQPKYGLEASQRLHDILVDREVPQLMAILPQLTHAPLDPDVSGGRPFNDAEIKHLHRMQRDGVTFAQHGTTHRTRHRNKRRRSELLGLSPADADALLERGRQTLLSLGIDPRVFVPPYNRFPPSHWSVLAARFDLICGGPESIGLMGWQGGPLWRDDAVYLPCYEPFYGRARDMADICAAMIDREPGTWIPLALHLSWEADDDFVGLRQLAKQVAPYAVHWDDLLTEIARSRNSVQTADLGRSRALRR